MPIHTVEGPDGTRYSIEAPEGATQAQILNFARQQATPAFSSSKPDLLPIDRRDDTLGQQFKHGLGRAWESTKGTVTELIPALAASTVGADDYAKEKLKQYQERVANAEETNPTAYKSYKDVRGIYDVPGYVAGTIGEAVPDIAALLTGAGAAEVIGKRLVVKGGEKLAEKRAAEYVAKKGLTGEAAEEATANYLSKASSVISNSEAAQNAAKYGKYAGAGVGSYALNAPDVFQSVYEKTGELHPYISEAMAVPIAMLDSFLPNRILDKLGGAGKAKLAEEILAKSTVIPNAFKKTAALELAKSVGGEALTETAQEALTSAAELMSGAKGEFFSQENIDRYFEAGLRSAIGGGAFAAPHSISQGLHARAENQRIKDAQDQKKADAEAAVEAAKQAAAQQNIAVPEPKAEPPKLLSSGSLFTPVVFPDGSVATTPEALAEYKEAFKQKQEEEFRAQFTSPYKEPEAKPPKLLPSGPLFSPVVFPDGSVATTPQQVIDYEKTLKQKQDTEFLTQFSTPSTEAAEEAAKAQELAGEPARRAQDLGAPITPAIDSAKAFKQAEPNTLPLFPEETVYGSKTEPVQAVVPSVLTSKILNELGVPKAAIVRKRVTGLELSDPNQANKVVTNLLEFARVHANPETRIKIEDYVYNIVHPETNTAQGALQFAPPAPSEGRFTATPQTKTTPVGLKLQTELSYKQKADAVEAQKEVELDTIANRAAAQRQLSIAENPYSPEAIGTPDIPTPSIPTATVPKPPTEQGAPNVNLAETGQTTTGTSIDVPPSIATSSIGSTESTDLGGVASVGESAASSNVGTGAQPSALTRTKENTPVPSDEAMRDAGLTDYEIDGYKRRPNYYLFNRINNGYKYFGGANFKRVTKTNVEKMRNLVARDKIQYSEDKKKIDAQFAKEDTPQLYYILGADWGGSNNNENYKDAAYAALNRKHGFAASMLSAMERILARTQGAPTETSVKTETQPIKGKINKAKLEKNNVSVEPELAAAQEPKFAAVQGSELTEQEQNELNQELQDELTGEDTRKQITPKVKTTAIPKEISSTLPMNTAPKGYSVANDVASSVDALATEKNLQKYEDHLDYLVGTAFGSGATAKDKSLARRGLAASKVTEREIARSADRVALINRYNKSDLVTKQRQMNASRIDLERQKQVLEGQLETATGAEQFPIRNNIIAIDKKLKNLKKYLYESLSSDLHPDVSEQLKNNNFIGAITKLSENKNPRIAALANKLLAAGVAPKVIIVHGLVNESGKHVAGIFDPRTNTIRLDAELGMNEHTLLHEIGHSALSHVLDNKNHPVTKQMQTLLDEVKNVMPSAYGTQDVHEFASETLGNHEFRSELSQLNLKGQKITAWQKFSNIVGNYFRNLLGLDSKTHDTALDKIDHLIDTILSPSPQYRDAGSLYAIAKSPSMSSKFINSAADFTEKLPLMNKEKANKVHEFISNILPNSARNFTLSTLPMNVLSEVSKGKVINAEAINKTVAERDGIVAIRAEQIDALVNRATNWSKAAGKKMVEMFNNVVYDSTTRGVDPTKARNTYGAFKLAYDMLNTGKDTTLTFATEKERNAYAARINAADPTKKVAINMPDLDVQEKATESLTAYDEVRTEYEKLNPAGKKLYVDMRNAYREMYDKIVASLEKKTDEILQGTPEKATIKNLIFRKLLERATLDPYFPLTREGNYWLSYTKPGNIDKEGNPIRELEAFSEERARTSRIETLAKTKAGEDFGVYSNLNQMGYKRVPSTSFVSDVVKTLELGTKNKDGSRTKVPAEQINAIIQLFLDQLPETAFAKSFQKRRDIPGFEKDSIGALYKKLNSTNKQIANMEYGAKLESLHKEMVEGIAKLKGSGIDNRTPIAYAEEWGKRVKNINNPQTSSLSRMATGLGFNFLLGLNISSAFTQTAQVPMVTLPHLGGDYGYDAARKAISNAYGVYFRSGRTKSTRVFGTKEMESRRAMWSLDNYNVNSKEYKRYEPLLRIAKERGQIISSQIYDTLEAHDRTSVMSKVNAITGFMFHHAERLNRQVTLVATYDLELERLTKGKNRTAEERAYTKNERQEAAANKAIYVSELTQGGTSAATAPRISQNSVGRVILMFKRYGISMLYNQIKQFKAAIADEDPKVRKAAKAQFYGNMGMAALFAGIQGVPFFGAVSLLYKLFKDDDDDDLDTVTRKYFGDMLTFGPLSYYTNIDVSGRVSQTDLLFREMHTGDKTSLADDVMQYFGGPVYGVATKIQRGMNLMRDGYVARGLEQMMPSAIGNIFKGVRFATEGANTLRGDPITEDITPWGVGAQLIGFSPANYQRENELNNRTKEIEKHVTEAQSKLMRQLYVAKRMGDTEGMDDYQGKLETLYEKHPSLGSLAEAVDRSEKAHEKTTEGMVHGISINNKLRDELMQWRDQFESH